MTTDESAVVELVRNVVSRYLGVDAVALAPDVNLDEVYGFDSVDVLEVWAAIELAVGQSIDPELVDVEELRLTVATLSNVVRQSIDRDGDGASLRRLE